MKSADHNTQEKDPGVDAKGSRITLWLKRIGVAGFLFFLLKGILWLCFGAAVVKYTGCGN